MPQPGFGTPILLAVRTRPVPQRRLPPDWFFMALNSDRSIPCTCSAIMWEWNCVAFRLEAEGNSNSFRDLNVIGYGAADSRAVVGVMQAVLGTFSQGANYYNFVPLSNSVAGMAVFGANHSAIDRLCRWRFPRGQWRGRDIL